MNIYINQYINLAMNGQQEVVIILEDQREISSFLNAMYSSEKFVTVVGHIAHGDKYPSSSLHGMKKYIINLDQVTMVQVH